MLLKIEELPAVPILLTLLDPDPPPPTVTVYDVLTETDKVEFLNPPAPPPPPAPDPPPPPPATTKYSTEVGNEIPPPLNAL
jgi:hypothetical protein